MHSNSEEYIWDYSLPRNQEEQNSKMCLYLITILLCET
jgi:hypothetical protein